jgi:hypothetical protein
MPEGHGARGYEQHLEPAVDQCAYLGGEGVHGVQIQTAGGGQHIAAHFDDDAFGGLPRALDRHESFFQFCKAFIQFSVGERSALIAAVIGHHLAVAHQAPLVDQQPFHAHGTPGVNLVGADAHLGAQAEAESIAEAAAAFQNTSAESTRSMKRKAWPRSAVTMTSVWPDP